MTKRDLAMDKIMRLSLRAALVIIGLFHLIDMDAIMEYIHEFFAP